MNDDQDQEPVESMEQEAQETAPQATPQRDNWKEAQRALADAKAERERVQAENDRLRDELRRAYTPPKQVEEPDEQLDPDDLPNVKQVSKLISREAKRLVEQQLAGRDARTEEQLFIARNPDFEDTIKNYLPEILKENPALQDSLKNNPRAHEIAYNLVKQNWKYRQDHAQESMKAQKILKNSSQPVSGNAASGVLKSKVDGFAAGMSKSEVWAKAQEYAKGG